MCGECDAGTIAACLSDTEPCSICIHVCNIVISRSTRGCRWLYLLSRTAANGTCAPRTSAEPPRTSRSVLRIQLSVLESSQSEQTKPPKTPRSSANRISVFSVAFCLLSTRAQAVPRVFSLRPFSPQPLYTALHFRTLLVTFGTRNPSTHMLICWLPSFSNRIGLFPGNLQASRPSALRRHIPA